MKADQIISMTDMRTKTKSVLSKMHQSGISFVVNNNKVSFVALTPDYREFLQKKIHIQNLQEETQEAKKNGPKTSRSKDFMNEIFS